MNLQEFTNGFAPIGPPTTPKPWLSIYAKGLLADSIHVGPGYGPVSAAQYSQTSVVEVINTTGPTSITAGGTHTGTLVVPPLPVGSIVRLTASGKVNTAIALDTCNFGVFIDGLPKTGPTNISTQGNAIAGAAEVRATVTIYPAGAAVAFITVSEINLVGPGAGFTLLQTNPFTYDNTVSHTFDLDAYFNRADPGNNFAAYSVLCELVNAN